MKRLFVTIGAALFSYMAHAEPAATRQQVDGEVVAQQVQAQLQAGGFSPITKIQVSAGDSGEVNLKGVAASDAEAARAVNLAKEVHGVKGVSSEIFVKRMQ